MGGHLYVAECVKGVETRDKNMSQNFGVAESTRGKIGG